MRYWLGAGRGGFGLGSAECVRPSFYCAVFTTPLPARTMEPSGITVKTSKLVTAPDAASAVIKSVNYLRNAICQDEAEAAGYDVGVFVDEEGYVVDGSNASVGIITKAGEVVVPPFDRALAGITAGRVLELLPEARGGTGRGGGGGGGGAGAAISCRRTSEGASQLRSEPDASSWQAHHAPPPPSQARDPLRSGRAQRLYICALWAPAGPPSRRQWPAPAARAPGVAHRPRRRARQETSCARRPPARRHRGGR